MNKNPSNKANLTQKFNKRSKHKDLQPLPPLILLLRQEWTCLESIPKIILPKLRIQLVSKPIFSQTPKSQLNRMEQLMLWITSNSKLKLNKKRTQKKMRHQRERQIWTTYSDLGRKNDIVYLNYYIMRNFIYLAACFKIK